MRREQVFWGWGEPGAGPSLGPAAERALRERLDVPGGVISRPVALEAVRLRAPALPAGLRERLAAIAPVRDDRAIRVLRCRGKSYVDLLAQRAGDCEDAPDAVVAPSSREAVQAVLEACAAAEVAVVPFGGGTSVVGGLEPLRGRFAALVSLDLGGLDAVHEVDAQSLTATVGAGLRLPEAERVLRLRGLALGHLPQSFEWASVGGCAATRSAGQTSTGHGTFADQVLALDCVTPAGALATRDAPRSAAGPSLRELVLGSEGVLGVITRVSVRVRAAAPVVQTEGWGFGTFAEGCAALRRLLQQELAPDVARLSDEEETAATLAFAGAGRAARLAMRGRRCLLVVAWQGTADAVARRRTPARHRLRAWGGARLGARAGAAWAASRFAGPYLRDDLLDRGVLVETLETAAPWTRLAAVHRAVRDALAGAHVGCHVSHVYPTGASLYFTVFAAQDASDPAGQWRSLKRRATDALVAAGGTVTHHHGVGTAHAPWLEAEDGHFGVEVLRAIKDRCDPSGIMNPGKLLAPRPDGASLS